MTKEKLIHILANIQHGRVKLLPTWMIEPLADALIEEFGEMLEKKDAELQEEKSRVSKLIAQNARLDYDLGYAYQTICKLKGDHYG